MEKISNKFYMTKIEVYKKIITKYIFFYIIQITLVYLVNIIPIFNSILNGIFLKLIIIEGITVLIVVFWFFYYKKKILYKQKSKPLIFIILFLIISEISIVYFMFLDPLLNVPSLLPSLYTSMNYFFTNFHYLSFLINGFLFATNSIYLILSTFIKQMKYKAIISGIASIIILGLILNFYKIFEIYSEPLLIFSYFLVVWQLYLLKYSNSFLNYKTFELKNHSIRSFALLFKKGNYRRGMAILEVVQLAKNMVVRESRELPTSLERLIVPQKERYIFYHLVPIADEIQQLSYEIVISKYYVKLRLYISIQGNYIEEELIDKLREKSDFVETAYKSCFKDIKFKNLVGQELLDAWGEIVEYGNYSFKRVGSEIIELNRTSNNLYISIILLDSIAPVIADLPITQIDQLINNLLTQNIFVHYISVIEPSSKFNFFKQLGQFYEDSRLTQNELDKSSLQDKVHMQLLNLRHSEFIQMWKTSTYIVVKAMDPELLKRQIQKTKAIFKNVFSSRMKMGNVRILEKKELENALPKIIMRDRINNVNLSSEQVISTFHLPESIVPSISIKREIPPFEIPTKLENLENGKMKIGTAIHENRLLYDTYIDLEELRLNMFIVGQVGMGKTEFTKNMLSELYRAAPNVNWVVLEWKGDYKDMISRINEPIQVIRAGSEENPLKINIFDPLRANPENHAMKIFSIIKEVFKSSFKTGLSLANYELSPQMEKITRDLLIECVRNPDKRSFKAFFHELRNYESKFPGNRNNSVSMSVAAIENRFQRFTSGILGKILNVEKSNLNFQTIMNKKIIFDLSSIIYEQGTKEDVRLLTNLILKYVIDQALRRGPMNELKHLVVIEDSQLLVPEVLREVPETTLGEDIPLLLRSVGEAMISVATRPRISDDIISNSAIKVTFRLNQADDTLKVSKYQNMNEEQEKYLRLLEKQEAIVTTLNFPHPFRIKTTTSYSKNVNNQEIIEHNLKNFPEMYENIEGLQKQPNLPNPINKELNRSKKNIDGNENYKKIGEQLSNWESKCLKNLSDDYKKAYLQIRTILAEPKTKSELIKKLDTSMDELNKFLNKFITLKLINYDFFPNFYSEVSIKRYHLNDNNNYIKLMIKEKLENDFKNSIQNSDINFFDYFVSSNKYYIKIFINRINDTNKYFFKELFSQWEEQIIKNKRSGLILIIPFISSIDAINSIIKENLKVPIIKIAYNEKSWEKLNKFFNDNTNLRTSGSQKNDNLLDIEKILNEIDNEGAHEIKELNQLLEENQEFKKKGNTNLDQNMSDENKIHSFLDNLQREIKEKSKK